MAKKKLTKDEKRKARLRKAKPWVATYQGSNILLAYGNKFKVDPICAAKDLEAMKASTEEQRSLLKQAHNIRIQKEREDRAVRLANKLEKRNIAFDKSEQNPAALQKVLKDAKTGIKKRNPKRRCVNCGCAMIQQFIGLNIASVVQAGANQVDILSVHLIWFLLWSERLSKKAKTVSGQNKCRLYGIRSRNNEHRGLGA